MTHPLRSSLLSVAVLCALFAAGCGTETRPERREGRASRREFTPMAGQENFFDNRLLAEVHVGTEGMPEPRPVEGRGGRDRGGPGIGPQGGARSRVNLSGAMGLSGNVSTSRPIGEGGRGPRGFGGGPRPGAMAGGGGRPVLIHLRFTNRTEAPIEIVIPDFVSPLGNFVVRPDKLKLEPGESVETEPMTSQLAGAFTETTAQLTLRLDGKVEKKAFPLKQVPPPAPPAK